jgi:hypothetical protein
VVLLHDAVAGTLGNNGLAMQLARQAQREFADVHAFLHLAQAFLSYLADLAGNHMAYIGLGAAQLLAPEPHQLAAHRGGHQAPLLESLHRMVYDWRHLGTGQGGQTGQFRAVDGRVHADVLALKGLQRYAAAAQHGLEVGSGDGSHGIPS